MTLRGKLQNWPHLSKKNNTENKWVNCLIEEDEKKSYNKAKDRKYIG